MELSEYKLLFKFSLDIKDVKGLIPTNKLYRFCKLYNLCRH